jgi:hypothetical protein
MVAAGPGAMIVFVVIIAVIAPVVGKEIERLGDDFRRRPPRHPLPECPSLNLPKAEIDFKWKIDNIGVARHCVPAHGHILVT